MRNDIEVVTRFKPFKLGRRARRVHSADRQHARLSPGDLVWWDDIPPRVVGQAADTTHESSDWMFGRLLGLVRSRSPRRRTGEAYVLCFNNGIVYAQFIGFDRIVQVKSPTLDELAKIRWLFLDTVTMTPVEMAQNPFDHSGAELMQAAIRGGPTCRL